MISQSPILRSHYESDEKFDEALAMATGLVEATLRQNRNALLAESDWTQFSDSPLAPEVKASWAAYRQQLRDMTQTLQLDFEAGFVIDESTYPTKPE